MVQYKKYKDSGIEWIGKIPDRWDVRKLKFVFTFGKGLSITKDNLTESGVSVISYGQIHSKENLGIGIIDTLKRYVDAGYLTTNKQSLVRNNDFIFADTSEDLEGVGNCVFVDNEDILFAGYHTIILRAKEIQHNKYLAYLFLSDYWRNQIRSRVTGVKVYSITKTILNGNTVLLPSIPEQEQIAKYLDWKCREVDRIVDVRERQIKLLGELRTSVISRAVTRGLDPNAPLKDSGIEWIGQIPEHWEIKRVKFTGKAIIGLTYSPNDIIDNGGSIVLRSTNIQNGVLDLSDKVRVNSSISEKLRIRKGDVLLCSRNGSASLVGKCAYINDDLYGVTWGAFTTVLRSSMRKYLYYALNSDIMKFYLGMFSTSTINQLTTGTLNNMELLIPPTTEQQQIADYLDKKTAEIDSTIKKFKAQIDKIKEYRQALITEVVTGKIDVRGIEIPATKSN